MSPNILLMTLLFLIAYISILFAIKLMPNKYNIIRIILFIVFIAIFILGLILIYKLL